MLLYLSGKVRKLDLISLVLIVAALIVCVLFIRSHFDTQIKHLKTEVFLYRDALGGLIKRAARPRYPFATQYEKVDYHDYEFILKEATKKGPGEQGEPFFLTDYDDIAMNKQLYDQFGFFALVSDRISVNRSLPDVRLDECKKKKYLERLPKVSVVIVFFDEYLSMLKRTLHSIINRSPRSLLHEIIVVNDKSTLPELYDVFTTYLKDTFGELVKVVELKERMGMISSRMEGAKIATGEVLVFLDALIEVNVNWLPPLLEPIALDPKIITTPIVDKFRFDTFEYKKLDDGGRRIFNWDLAYRKFPKLPQDQIKPYEPFQTPTMIGTAFAMNRQFFWDIGAYDHDLKVWQGEQLEMSFKAHLCGHGILEVPCSRIAHNYRNTNNYYKRFENGTDHAVRNLKRIAEVWMDEFKDYVYERNPVKFTEVELGDLTREKAIRESLHCKPFRYFLEYVAPDMINRYPINDPGCFAKGAIQSKANPSFCIEVSKENVRFRKLLVGNCNTNRIVPNTGQYFILSIHRNIQHASFDVCITNSLTVNSCHYMGGNQYWKYDLDTSQIINPLKNGTTCIALNVNKQELYMAKCNSNNTNQKWNFGEKNITALRNWESFGVDIATLKYT